jgi:hypothetical protein
MTFIKGSYMGHDLYFMVDPPAYVLPCVIYEYKLPHKAQRVFFTTEYTWYNNAHMAVVITDVPDEILIAFKLKDMWQ